MIFLSTILIIRLHLYSCTIFTCPTGSPNSLKGCIKCSDKSPLVIASAHPSSWVRSVAFNPDSSLLVSAGLDKSVNIWNSKTGASVRKISGHTLDVKFAIFSPDGTMIASGASDKTIRITRSSEGTLIHSFTGHTDVVRWINFFKDSDRFVSSSNDKTIKMWSISGKKLIKTFSGSAHYVTSVDISSDETKLLSSCYDNSVSLWDVGLGTLIKTFSSTHTDYILSIRYSKQDSNKFVTGAYDQTAIIWTINPISLEVVSRLVLRSHTLSETKAVFSPDSKTVATCNEDFTVKLWDSNTGINFLTFTGHTKALAFTDFSPDGTLLASGRL